MKLISKVTAGARTLIPFGSLVIVWLTVVGSTVLALFAQTQIYVCYAKMHHLAAAVHTSLPQLVAGYRSLRNYLLLPWVHTYHLPVRQSQAGMQHFAEVKVLVGHLEVLTLVLLVLSIFICARLHQTHGWWQWYLPSYWLLMLVLAGIMLVGLNFNQSFIEMHHVLFRDLTWEFDPKYDPIILALPEGYFSLLAALVGIIGCGGPLLVIWWLCQKLRK